MPIILLLLLLLSCGIALNAKEPSASGPFLIKPYIQLGSAKNALSILFAVGSQTSGWELEYKNSDDSAYMKAPLEQRTLNGNKDIKLICAQLNSLSPGSDFNYKVSQNGKQLFSASAQARPKEDTDISFGVLGDCGMGSKGEELITLQLANKHPAMVLIPGDIVYPCGRLRDYLRNFFPFFNGKKELMGKSLFVACPGNHDIAMAGMKDVRNLDESPDGMAYFSLWQQPLNGPITKIGNTNSPELKGSKQNIEEFVLAAAGNYPVMANFSYDYGNSHFLILDGNKYVNWQDQSLRKWVDDDLGATKSKWKFVLMHQPGFSSDWHHQEEQQMRLLADIFEKNKVDIVFSGHSHSYQRSCPLQFKLARARLKDQDRETKAGFVQGSFKFDRNFDGQTNKKAQGVIYIVSGAGGAKLSLPLLEEDPTRWQPFTRKFICKQHSFSFCRASSENLILEQIGQDGTLLDQIIIEK
ncbi:MAG: metallophosphoesterase [Candidatus Obscuribacterales bacterium]|nr:metallophosphoesterase [Candidatus Obscuribacterales bacterium]